MTEGIDKLNQKLSEISGLPERDIKQTWNRVKENRNALDGCNRHDFSIDLLPERQMAKR